MKYLSLAAAAATFAGFVSAASAATISISCGAVGTELEDCKTGAEAWAAKTGHEVQIVSTPPSSSERLALYQQILSAKSGDIDVFQVDVVWPSTLAPHLIDLKPHFDQAEIDKHFPQLISNNTVDGKLVAMPWFTDAGLLYYRSDLLEKYGHQAPRTWDELTKAAQDVQDKERAAGNGDMWGFVFQGRAYEGLTCAALEWVDSHGGGTIVSADGEITINNPKAAQAIDMGASFVNTISPQGVLNYAEEDARSVFQSGNAVFMRNWPYAWNLAQQDDSPIKGKVGVVPIPMAEGGKHSGTLGGWQLAVSKYSDAPEAAADLVKYLTSAEEQKRRAIKSGRNPTIVSLYDDKDLLEANPFVEHLKDIFSNGVARPSLATGEKYSQVSSAFWNAVHSTLSGRGNAEQNLANLEKQLERISRGGKW